jgi:2-amino-4-hydroxy-6-hydroxymethyldihydropteridine diphosphokinase
MCAAQKLSEYVLGLGSNLGDRRLYLVRSARAIAEFGTVLKVSPLYETRPVGPEQPDYLNAALLLETALSARALLEALLEVEQRLGRQRSLRWGPRIVDLDILWVAGRTVEEPGLVVPHAELARRAFALVPLLDVAPDARDPGGRPYSELLSGLDRTVVRELPGTRAGWVE